MNEFTFALALLQNLDKGFNEDVRYRSANAIDALLKGKDGSKEINQLQSIAVLVNIAGTMFANIHERDGRRDCTQAFQTFLEIMAKAMKTDGINVEFVFTTDVDQAVDDVTAKAGLKVEKGDSKTVGLDFGDEMKEFLNELKKKHNI